MRLLIIPALMSLFACECGDAGGGGTGGGAGGGGGGSNNAAVASIDLPQLTVLEVGKTAQLVPVALDRDHKVIGDVAFTFTSSDSSVATVSDGLVTAVKQGATFVTAMANGVSSNLSVVTVIPARMAGPSSDELLATAVTQGVLDDETALVYRVYAAFGDARLPLAFKGNDDGIIDSDALDVARDRWPSLKPENQALLEPFFAPPAYLGSWASLDRKPRALIGVCQNPQNDPNWAAYPISGGRVKVWYDTRVPGSFAQAQKVSVQMETKIWDAITSPTGLNMKPPKPDGSDTGCNGGDGRLDIYLGDMAVFGHAASNFGETQPNVAPNRKAAPAYMLLNRTKPDDELFATAAHEFMHACQWSYDVAAIGMTAYGWLMESTAQEALDHVYPGVNLEQKISSSGKTHLRVYLDTPANPINEGSRERAYGSYPFFQYLVRSGSPAVIGAIWDKTLTNSEQLKAVDLGIPGGLVTQWPLFARVLWNDAPIDTQAASFTMWDMMKEKPLYGTVDGDLHGAREHTISYQTEAKNVSMRFAKVTFTDPATRFQLYRAMKPIHVHALWQTEDNTWQEEDWSDLEWIGFCRDQKDQRLKQLIVIVSSAQTEGDALTPPSAPTLERNNLPCWGLEGTATRVTRDRAWSSGMSSFTVTGRWGAAPVTQYFNQAEGLLRVQIAGPPFESGSGTFDENYTQGPCTYSASGSYSLTSVTKGGEIACSPVINHFPKALPPMFATEVQHLIGLTPRAYHLAGVSNRIVMGTVSGTTSCTGTYVTGPRDFVRTQKDNFESGGVPKLALDDGSFDGSLVDGDSTFTWHFTPRREP